MKRKRLKRIGKGTVWSGSDGEVVVGDQVGQELFWNYRVEIPRRGKEKY